MIDGITLYTETGKPVKITLMDSDEEWLEPTQKLEEGVFVYENSKRSITMFLEKP